MNACASSSSGPPVDVEPSFMSPDGKLISKAHADVIRGGVSKKRINCARLSLSSDDQKMKAAMENRSPQKKQAQKTSTKKKRKKRIKLHLM